MGCACQVTATPRIGCGAISPTDKKSIKKGGKFPPKCSLKVFIYALDFSCPECRNTFRQY